MDYGFVRVAAAVPNIRVADCAYNAENIIQWMEKAEDSKVQLMVFPELSITAYTCGDLFHQQLLRSQAVKQLGVILERTGHTAVVAMVGLPLQVDNQLFNCAAVIQSGRVLGIVPKTYIPGYSEFYEERWFSPGTKASSDTVTLFGQSIPFGTDVIFESEGDHHVSFGVEICEDLWVPQPPSSILSTAGASLLFNLSASNEVIGKYEYRRDLVKQQSGRCIAGYVFASAGIDESTTDVVFGGHAIIAENGGILAQTQRFSAEGQWIYTELDVEKLANDRSKNTSFMEAPVYKDFRKVAFKLESMESIRLTRAIDAHPFVPFDARSRDDRCGEIFAIQTAGLGKRLRHTGMQKAVIGISGGLDSTLALLVTAKTFDQLGIPRENIHTITMPGFGTTDVTYQNSLALMKSMGTRLMEVDIRPACLQHFKDIGHDTSIHDVTYENVQARERTQILMDFANKNGGLVIGTGDLSELALGWCTYNGDHMSMYSVNCSIPKTLVKFLVQWVADNMVDPGSEAILHSILDTPITPELLPPDPSGKIKQKTEELIGPYELHDFFLYHAVRYGAPPKKILFLAEQAFQDVYSKEEMLKWLKVFFKRFFGQQFKRSCLPDGPKVGTISLSPRGDWRMPSDAEAALWLSDLDEK